MAELKITSKMAADKALELIDAVWPNLKTQTQAVEDATDKDKFRDDYAKIIEFLADKDKVAAYLKPLDAEIKARLDELAELEDDQDPRVALKSKVDSVLKDGAKNFYMGEPFQSKPFKTHKVLSGCLDAYENQKGFNAAQATLGKLHTTAMITGDPSLSTDVQFQNKIAPWTDYNTTGAKKVQDLPAIELPKGTPTLSGILLKSFNPILLKNGFHWKDPGADALIHGEFTHRLQWYAIGHAYEGYNKGTVALGKILALSNTPAQIFKSMGYLFSGAKNEDTTVYLWEMLCDNFAPDRKPFVGKPSSPDKDCFTCPDYLNGFVSQQTMGFQPPSHSLPYLNIMMWARYIKRAQEQKSGANSTDKIVTGQKKVGFGVTSLQDEQGAAIYWVKHS